MIRVLQLEVREDGKVYQRIDQPASNPTYVVKSQGEYFAALNNGGLTATIVMNRTWVSKDVFEAIMIKVQQALIALEEGVEGQSNETNVSSKLQVS